MLEQAQLHDVPKLVERLNNLLRANIRPDVRSVNSALVLVKVLDSDVRVSVHAPLRELLFKFFDLGARLCDGRFVR